MKKVLLICIITFSFTFVWSQNYKIQAILTYNFTKYLTWPDDSLETFKIGVCGNTEFLNEMKVISINYSVNDKKIEVLEFKKPEDLEACHICYIHKEKSDELEAAANEFSEFPTLVISSNSENVIKGVGINFVIVDSKQRFEIYPSTILKRDIKINPELLDMGIIKKAD